MPHQISGFRNKAPFIRIIIPFIAGLIYQSCCALSLSQLIISITVSLSAALVYNLLDIKNKYRLRFVNGLFIYLLIIFTAALLFYLNDVRNNKSWFGKKYKTNDHLIITLQEPLSEKANSYKALAAVNSISGSDSSCAVTGFVLVYFKKEGLHRALGYGSRLLISAPALPVSNSGNPGSFDYREYCVHHNITHQAFLQPDKFIVLPAEHSGFFIQYILQFRSYLVSLIRKKVKSKKESGMAEALLIGYKDDLDPELVQSYTSTGVVHIIAISGMHLALIYLLLIRLTGKLQTRKLLNWLRILLVLAALWAFTFLSGAQPSVLRSVINFTCILVAEILLRRTSAINSLAFSAFLLLCFDPYLLWDAGFQLSYTAVLSILIFYKPLSGLYYFNNKILNGIWKSMVVGIAAQILTVPVSIYHFHQFPLLFILTNLVAVPLSGIIVVFEIILCLIGAVPFIGNLTGYIIMHLVRIMDQYIERLASVSFASLNNISFSLAQSIILLIAISACSAWLLQKRSVFLWVSLISGLLLVVLNRWAAFTSAQQQKLIVYNIPHQQAVELISGRKTYLMGNTQLFSDVDLRNKYLVPAHRALNINHEPEPEYLPHQIIIKNTHILILDSSVSCKTRLIKPCIDIVVLSGGPQINIGNLLSAFLIKHIVIDASVPFTKAIKWQRECDSLQIPCFNVHEKGACQINLQTPTFAFF